MNKSQRPLLYVILGLFIVLAGVLTWSFFFQSTSFFYAGTHPTIAVPAGPDPVLPPIRPEDPSAGSQDPNAITLVEYADFTCLYCRASRNEVAQILSENPNIHFVWRDFPIASDNPSALLASMAGRCAKDQGKFWEMHDALFQADKITIDSLQTSARELGLNENTFSSCLTTSKYLQNIQDDIVIARNHNINSAPTFFIGDQVIQGYATAADLRWALLLAK